MVLVVDDTLLFPLAMLDEEGSLPLLSPNIYMLVLNSMKDYALRELYPLEKIQNQIKENRLLYEFGEISKDEYKNREAELIEKLRIAQKVREMSVESKIDVL
ncbi:MAG: gas vesicle protein GvpG [archaeon]